MSSPYAAAEMLQREIEDRSKAYSTAGQKLAAENATLKAALKAIINQPPATEEAEMRA